MDETVYLSCSYEITNHGTSYPEWQHLLRTLCCLVNNVATRQDKQDVVGYIVYVLRQEYIEGHKRLNRKYHLDTLIDALNEHCSLDMSEMELAIANYENDEQYQLAPKTYSKFTGMLIQKLLGIPEKPGHNEKG